MRDYRILGGGIMHGSIVEIFEEMNNIVDINGGFISVRIIELLKGIE